MAETYPEDRSLRHTIFDCCSENDLQSREEVIEMVRMKWGALWDMARRSGTPCDITPSRIESIILTMISEGLLSASFKATASGTDLHEQMNKEHADKWHMNG